MKVLLKSGDWEKWGAIAYSLVMLVGLGLIFGGLFWRRQSDQRRLATETHIPATILSVQEMRGGPRAWIAFTRMENGVAIACRTEVNLGPYSVAVGQVISVVPRPDSCGEPAVAVRR